MFYSYKPCVNLALNVVYIYANPDEPLKEVKKSVFIFIRF
jgi:hypothetical protein